MAKAFFGVILLSLLGLLAYVMVPKAIMKPCPVCQGRGVLESAKTIETLQAGQPQRRDQMLCPFCQNGRISKAELKELRSQMLRWMVKEQKLKPEELVRRVREGWGEDGLMELHRTNYFLDVK